MQYHFAISSSEGCKVIREKETQTLLPTVNHMLQISTQNMFL